MSSLTNTPQGFEEISYPTVRAGSIAETPNHKISSEELDAFDVFHFSIPNVQDFGEGQWEPGNAIDSDKWIVSSESVLISKLNPRKSTVCLARPRNALTVSSTEFVAFDAGDGHDNKFLYYVLGSAPVTSYLSSLTTSVTRSHQRVQPSDIKSMRIPWPQGKRRRQIADYLDQETAEIDSFISSSKKFYHLANERHLAEIEDEVWNKDYPLVRIKFFTDVLPGFSFKSVDFEDYSDETVRLLRGINVTPGAIDWDNCVALPGPESKDYHGYLLQAGDLVLGLDRPIVNSGLRLAEIDDESKGSLLVQRVARIRITTEKVLRRWLYAALQGTRFEAHLAPSFTGVSVPHMSPGQLENFEIPVPPLEIQNAKLRILTRSSEQHTLLKKDIAAAIDLARERRAALIAAAVTGQIDVTARNKPVAEQLEDDVAQGLHREYA